MWRGAEAMNYRGEFNFAAQAPMACDLENDDVRSEESVAVVLKELDGNR